MKNVKNVFSTDKYLFCLNTAPCNTNIHVKYKNYVTNKLWQVLIFMKTHFLLDTFLTVKFYFQTPS